MGKKQSQAYGLVNDGNFMVVVCHSGAIAPSYVLDDLFLSHHGFATNMWYCDENILLGDMRTGGPALSEVGTVVLFVS